MDEAAWTPVTIENCGTVPGPFYHGTKIRLDAGELLKPGHPSNFETGRMLRHIYFSSNLEPAVWGAELSVALSGAQGRGYIYEVLPLGGFEDDPNLTNKRFAGNPTRSYRTKEPLLITAILETWEGHPKEQISKMLEGLEELRRQGRAVIED